MPFLDHLEELRVRIVKALLAIAIGCVLGFWVVQKFHVVTLLKKPIEPFLTATGGRLAVSAPTEGVFIVFKLALVVGLLMASPVLIYQIWAFLAPALYLREKKLLVPALLSGLALFITGAALGWLYVVPQALDVLLGFQGADFATLITFQAYYDFVIQILLALGLSFELPLILIILAAVGLVTPQSLNKFRRFAIVLSCIAGAFLSPGTDVISMVMMTVPLLLLYEIGVAGTVVVHRRRMKAARIAAAT
jgi:sec-independent protein translocase protein TatC